MPWSISQLLHLPPCLNSPKSDDKRSPPHSVSTTVEKGNVGRGCERVAKHTGVVRGGAGLRPWKLSRWQQWRKGPFP
ncbi:hypothetical protein ES332_A09G075200v1 [Gossypium tomentosum]|uniref:Uncharacterized protein n=1 Tax=Gossypium tomentosum TaxID=34277 RepID=A0A5D2NZL5_GOSTO|nr:hypothetical protein ES332_A09G075200v1 [Gossypium tomentosum]